MNAKKEFELTQKIKVGDKKALEKLIKANLKFVVFVAKQYQNQGLELPDLINEGNLGLIKAAKRFDETRREFKFISYAVWWIRQYILRAIDEKASIIRLPLNKIGSSNKVNKVYNALEQKFERTPTPEEIAGFSQLTLTEVNQSLNNGWHVILDDSLIDREDAILYSITSCESNLSSNSLKEEINRVLGKLTSSEADIISLYFGLNELDVMELEEIGEKFDLTRESVRKIKEKAVRRLRENSRNKVLKTYLG